MDSGITRAIRVSTRALRGTIGKANSAKCAPGRRWIARVALPWNAGTGLGRIKGCDGAFRSSEVDRGAGRGAFGGADRPDREHRARPGRGPEPVDGGRA